MPKPLVIVESPAKARTLSRFLGDDYRVEASYGHIRDLPENPPARCPPPSRTSRGAAWASTSTATSRPYYVIRADKKKHIRDLGRRSRTPRRSSWRPTPTARASRSAGTSEKLLKPKVPVRRIVFHEITEEAIRGRHRRTPARRRPEPGRAQESRRIVDRLYGYTLSPVLWKKVQTGLSAGRVQSVAVRLIVEREEERQRLPHGAYWDLEATPEERRGAKFAATLDPRRRRGGSPPAGTSTPAGS